MIGPLFYMWCVPVPGCETKNVHSEYTCERKKKGLEQFTLSWRKAYTSAPKAGKPFKNFFLKKKSTLLPVLSL